MTQSENFAFKRVSTYDWKIAASADAKRVWHLLNAPDYVDIVSEVVRSVSSLVYKRETLKEDRAYSRLVATLSCSSALPVDLFHNSAAGYRAQYYIAPELGDQANRHAVAAVGRLIAEEMQVRHKRGCSTAWATASIQYSDAKVWIHQGRRLRAPDVALKQLHVDRWRVQPLLSDQERKRARYSQLTPSSENRIDFKDGFVSLDGEPFGTLKPCRAMHMHANGFT